MTEISNLDPQVECHHQQVILQQQTLISVLKQQIMRLQLLVIDTQRDRDEKQTQLNTALEQIETLKQKIDSLKENNQSLIQTFQVFQRQFVKRDYKLAHIKSKKENKDIQDGPLFIELIRTMRMKFMEPAVEPLSVTQKSFMNQYYGFFFHEQLTSQQVQLYNDTIQPNKLKTKTQKIRNFGKKNFLNQKFRHHFWFNTLDNTLKLSYKYYQYLLEIYDSNRQNQPTKTTIIDLDLRRMDLKIDEQKSQTMKIQIKKCLQIFKLYRPDIGYVQGMSYLAWMLLIRLEGYQAFVCFSNMILCDPFVHSLYFFKGENIKRIISFYEECLQDKKPKLSRHMKNLLVQPQLFIIQWAYTLFSRAFSLRLSSKIWDLWFCQGFNAFFKSTMVIMEMLEAEIMEQNENDKIIEILRTQTHKLDQKQFLKNLQRQRLFQDLKF